MKKTLLALLVVVICAVIAWRLLLESPAEPSDAPEPAAASDAPSTAEPVSPAPAVIARPLVESGSTEAAPTPAPLVVARPEMADPPAREVAPVPTPPVRAPGPPPSRAQDPAPTADPEPEAVDLMANQEVVDRLYEVFPDLSACHRMLIELEPETPREITFLFDLVVHPQDGAEYGRPELQSVSSADLDIEQSACFAEVLEELPVPQPEGDAPYTTALQVSMRTETSDDDPK